MEVLPRSEPTCRQEWTWYRMAESTLEDAQLMVVCRRWLTGDPQPWPGACDLREDHDGPHASVSLSGLVVDVRPNGEDE